MKAIGPAMQQQQYRCREFDDQRCRPEPGVRPDPPLAEQETRRAGRVIRSQVLHPLHIGMWKKEPRMRHDARIEDHVDDPDDHPGRHHDDQRRTPAGPRPLAGTNLRRQHDARGHRHDQQSGDLRRCHRPARDAEPDKGAPISTPAANARAPRRRAPWSARTGDRPRRDGPIPSTSGSSSQSNAATTPDQRPNRSDARA